MVGEIPQAVLEATEKVEYITRHRWLYSVVPSGSINDFNKIQMYLAGYCSNCKKVFSVIIPQGLNGEYRETPVPVSQYCNEG